MSTWPNVAKRRVPRSPIGIFTRYFTVVLVIVSINALQNGVLFGAQPAFAQPYPRFVELPTQPIAIVANHVTNKLYIANYNNSITVLDGQTEKFLKQITLYPYDEDEYGTALVSLAINVVTNKIYAASKLVNTIYVIDGTIDSVIRTITLDQYQRGESIAVNPATNRVYVAGWNDILYVIDGETDGIVERIDIGDHTVTSGDVSGVRPAELTLNPNTNLIYATNPSQDLISVINGSTNMIDANITVQYPFAALINPSTNKLYVSYESSKDIKVLDAASHGVVATIDNAFAAQFRNTGIAINPELNLVYATRYSDGEDSIVIIDGKNYNSTEIKLLDPIKALGVNQATDRLYVAVDGWSRLYVIDAAFARQRDSPKSSYDLPAQGIKYSTTAGEVTKVAADEDLLTVTITVRTIGDGFFQILFPREFMTSFFKLGSASGPYYGIEVFVDGVGLYNNPTVVADCNFATFRFPIDAGTETIEFVGTFVPADLPPSPTPERYMFLHEGAAANGATFRIRVATNAESCNLSLIESEKRLHVSLAVTSDKQGFLELTLPHYVLGGNYTVLIDGKPTNDHNATFVRYGDPRYYLPEISGDATIITLEYDGSNTKSIDIVGTSVIPEFGTLPIILVLTMTVASILVPVLRSLRH